MHKQQETQKETQKRTMTQKQQAKQGHAHMHATLKHPDELRDGKSDSYRSRNPMILSLPPAVPARSDASEEAAPPSRTLATPDA